MLGDIIFEFDGDDIMLPGKLRKQYDLFKQYPSIDLVFHRAEYFSDDKTYISETGEPAGIGDKAGYGYTKGMFLFLIKNIRYLRYSNVIKTARMRLSVAPNKRIR